MDAERFVEGWRERQKTGEEREKRGKRMRVRKRKKVRRKWGTGVST